MKKMFMLMIISLILASCASGFEEMMEDSVNADAALLNVQISSGNLSPAFTKGKTSYSLNAGENVDTITITAVPEKSSSTMLFRTDGGSWQTPINGNEATVSGIIGMTVRLDIQVTSFDGKGVVIYSFFAFSNFVSLVPTVSTTNIKVTTPFSAEGGGNISLDGGEEVTARGLCWSTSPSPTINDNKTNAGSGTGSFTSAIINQLTAGTQYYVRAYASNSKGTGYGEEVILRTYGFQSPTTSGFLFYDKGEYTDGWRYLEAFPSDYGPTGSGIANALAYFNSGPLQDWYIPTKDDMGLIYDNLVLSDTIPGTGYSTYYGLSVNYYCSSSTSGSNYYFVKFYTGTSPNYTPYFSKDVTGSNTSTLNFRAVRKF